MGWTADNLPNLGDDPNQWTVAEAAVYLGPPQLSVTQVRQLIRLCSIEPVGKRRAGPRASGRYPLVFDALELIKAYDALHRINVVE